MMEALAALMTLVSLALLVLVIWTMIEEGK
jgi:hypothetical protein